MLTLVAQARPDRADPVPPHQVERGRAEQGQDRGPLPLVERALVLAQGHILDAVQAVLDAPRRSFERQEPLRWARLQSQTGEAMVQRLVGLAVRPPDAPQAEGLCQSRPGDVVVQGGRGDQMAHVVPPPVATVDRTRLALDEQGQGRQAGGGAQSRRMS
jgi:hypothetical protein